MIDLDNLSRVCKNFPIGPVVIQEFPHSDLLVALKVHTMYIHTQSFNLPKDDILDGAPLGKGQKMGVTNHIQSQLWIYK